MGREPNEIDESRCGAGCVGTELRAGPVRGVWTCDRRSVECLCERIEFVALIRRVRGLTKRRGLFYAGTPTDAYFFDDGVVLVYPPQRLLFIPVFGALGAAVAAGLLERQVKRMLSEAEDLSAAQFAAARKHAELLGYSDMKSLRLEPKSAKSRRMVFETPGDTHRLSYRERLWPDADAASALGSRLGERFVNAVG